MKKKINPYKEVKRAKMLFIGLFLVLIMHLIYFKVIKSSHIIINAYNPRLDLLEDHIIRGRILTEENEVIAETVKLEDHTYDRVYPYGRIFSHIVGFSSRGKSGIESYANYELLASDVNIFEKVWNEITEQKNTGNSVVTTLNSALQETAYNALGDNKGAIVAIEPSTGKVLCMVSKPDFDPNEIDLLLSEISNKKTEETFLYNRATQGLYPPGSTFKILTTLSYILENPTWEEFNYICKGIDVFYNNDIPCFHNTAHGEVNLQKALALSCNTAFAKLGTMMDLNKLEDVCEKFLFNNKLPFPLPYEQSQYDLDMTSKKEDIPETVIGQGKTVITPLHNALIAATIANGGIMMRPYFMDHIENYQGKLIKKFMPEKFERIIETNDATIIKQLMSKVVDEGTARKLNDLPFTVAAKTGSAQFKEGAKTHAWFIGFAPVENPQIAISIIMEDVGTGSQYAIPIAKKLFDIFLN